MGGKVTLTFDNGPTPGVTDAVLDELDRRDLSATFFVVGERLTEPAGMELVQRAFEAGHWIGNHTYTHAAPLGTSAVPGESEREIRATQDLIGRCAHADKLFRPSGGGGELGPHLLNMEAADYLEREGFTCVLWNVVPRDWENPRWVEDGLTATAERDWSVVVLHDLPGACLERLPTFLDALDHAGTTVTQELPEAVLAMHRGVPATDLGRYVSDAPSTSP
jgi:peptidoglycan/xylan/chitin deacetylase (PgdA/CDA1 family)